MSAWKDQNCSQTSMTQTIVRGELFHDFRWPEMTLIDTHGPDMLKNDSRHTIMGFIEQNHRKGKTMISKKKSEECGGIKIGCYVARIGQHAVQS